MTYEELQLIWITGSALRAYGLLLEGKTLVVEQFDGLTCVWFA